MKCNWPHVDMECPYNGCPESAKLLFTCMAAKQKLKKESNKDDLSFKIIIFGIISFGILYILLK